MFLGDVPYISWHFPIWRFPKMDPQLSSIFVWDFPWNKPSSCIGVPHDYGIMELAIFSDDLPIFYSCAFDTCRGHRGGQARSNRRGRSFRMDGWCPWENPTMDDNWRYPPSNGENGWKGVKKGTFSIHFGVFRVHPSSLGRGQGFGEQLGRVGKCSFYSKLQNHRI